MPTRTAPLPKVHPEVPILQVELGIVVVRGQNVLLDAQLAALYSVTTKALIQAVKRNLNRFPSDFMFPLAIEEWDALRSQSVTSNIGRGGRRYAPYAFTEQGVAMLSSVLGSAQAISVNIEIMRSFVRLREFTLSNKELALRLDELESKTEMCNLKHTGLEADMRVQLELIFDAIRSLMAPPELAKRRGIGFVLPDEQPSKD